MGRGKDDAQAVCVCVCVRGIEVCSVYLSGSMRVVQAQIMCCLSMNYVLARGK